MVMDQSKNRLVKIETQLEGSIKESLEEFMKANIDVIAYIAIEITKVDLSTIVHCLIVSKDYKLVKQKKKKKKHPFAPDRLEPIREEITKLTQIKFTSEVMHPE